MLFCFTLLVSNFKVYISIKEKPTLLLVTLLSFAGGREAGGGNALTGNGSSREPRSGQLSPGFHFSKGEGGRGEGFVLVTPFTDLKTSKLFHSNHFVFFS